MVERQIKIWSLPEKMKTQENAIHQPTNDDMFAFEQMCRGVVHSLNIPVTDPDFEDYLQEMRLLVMEVLSTNPGESCSKNNRLYNRLRWRLMDLLRRRNLATERHEDLVVGGDESHQSNEPSHNPAPRYEANMAIAECVRQAEGEVYARVMAVFAAFPDDEHPARIARLKIPRRTYFRQYKMMVEAIRCHYSEADRAA
jgi:hypothetical protein